MTNSFGKKTIGLYIKDKVNGVGTLTFINPNTCNYASLGHGIDGALQKGEIYNCSINGVKKAVNGIPGEKYATLSNSEIGSINSNTNIGVFGKYNLDFSKSNTIPVLKSNSVKNGKAQIATVINGETVEYFDVYINTIKNQSIGEIKGIEIKVIDDKLINSSGGIIQGMSGSPIIQNGCLVGAVSHVKVDNPVYGYGVFAEWMYNYTK